MELYDEYGGTIVSLEDARKFDRNIRRTRYWRKRNFKKIEEGVYLVDAEIDIQKFNLLKWKYTKNSYSSLVISTKWWTIFPKR